MRRGVLVACFLVARVAGALPVDVDGDGQPDTELAWEGPATVSAADSGGHRVVLVRGGARAYLGEWRQGRLEELWTGTLGPQDVDGEWSRELELGDDGVLLYETRPDVSRCDGSAAKIYPRRLDFGTRRFRPVSLVPEVGEPALLATRTPPPGLSERTAPTVFRFEAATITSDDGGSAEGLSAPRELDDGRADTAWSEALPGFGRGAIFVARAATPRARVLALRVRANGSKVANRPRRLIVTTAGKSSIFELADSTATLWLALPDPRASSCVDVVLEAVHAGTSARGGNGRTEIPELVVLTDLDAGGDQALAELARAVAAGGPGGSDAEHHLVAQGARGAAALLDAARGAAPDELRRLRLALARTQDPRAASELVAGLGAHADDAPALVDGLRELGDAAVPPLAALVVDDHARAAAREHAARLLGAAPAPAAREALLAAAGRGPGAVRRAVIVAVAGRPSAESTAILDAARGRSPDLWRAAALHARRLPPEGRAAVVDGAAGALSGAPLELRYRLLQALATLGATNVLGPALAAEPVPALRQAALEALGDGGDALLAGAIHDADPGVRASAAAALARRPAAQETDVPLVGRLRDDGWPMVRRAAADALAARCGRAVPADGLVAAARGDVDENVRRAALAGLVRCGEPRAGAELVAVARDRSARASLRAYAASLLGPLGDARRAPDLVVLLEEARLEALGSPDPVAADGALRLAAAAANALGHLADGGGDRALLDAAADGAFPVIQAAAITALARRCPAGARPVIERAAESGDALVVRAARLAGDRCLPAAPAP